ncbi:glycosyltransferase family 2 protein [Pseudomonas protegens]|uniref:glycosyltransferase n=1 Tax=Pseudomonas protegens TaxID=380021 RepID=UPI0014732A18|nr:glycosyltransferase family A protein [Pseudomonas protegens]NMZ26450.1 glycosyltransferase family 2 protein [Pseudomonas protegens]NMZ84229.1 glycosyltransferase family 2 protein [Pseudomonas protegens]
MQRISVIVPMYNEARHITRTLDSVLRAARAATLDCELIVVDNGSTDQGPQRARELGARVLLCPGIGIGALRNRGAAVATGDSLAFLDADIEVPGNWLQLWQQAQAEQRAEVFALDCAAPASAPWFARAWQRRSLAGDPQPRLLPWMPTPNLCLQRAWFERVGGFNEQLRTGEDKDFGLRLHAAGARQLSLPQPQVLHWGYEASWAEWAGKERWRQGSHVQLLKGSGLSLRLLRFPLLCLACALLSLVALLCLLAGLPGAAGLCLLLGALAPLALAVRQGLRQRDPLFVLQLWLLHWVRLHLGALAMVQALFNRSAERPDRG